MKTSLTEKYPIPTLLKWLWQTSKGLRTQALTNALLGCMTVFLDFAFIWATKQVIDIAIHQSTGLLWQAASYLIAIILLQLSIGLSSKWLRALLGVKAVNRTQQRLFRRQLNSVWMPGKDRHSGDIINRLEKDTTDVVNAITETVPTLLAVSVRLVGAFLFLYSMDSRLACIIIALLPCFILLSKVYVKKMRALTRDIRQTESRVQSVLQEAIQHRVVVKTLERSNTMAERLETVQSHLRRQVVTRTKFSSFSNTILNLGFASCYLTAFLWGAVRLEEGSITYGMMMAFIQLVGQIQGPFRDFTRFIPVLINTLTASERLMELEETPLEDTNHPVKMGTRTGIRFENVSYAYTSKSRQVFHRFSYDFAPGSSTAILGETGAGKTTLIRLMLNLVSPSEGRITIYNEEKEMPCDARARCNFVYVPQGNTLFSGTVRDNLLLGNPEADEADMIQALHDACAEFILGLPDGLDTRCGELGNGLSEGQAQRIAIARALLRDGSILLLDEATSALDQATEQRLLDNLSRLSRQRTLIFITHRPAIIKHCSQVLHIQRNPAPL